MMGGFRISIWKHISLCTSQAPIILSNSTLLMRKKKKHFKRLNFNFCLEYQPLCEFAGKIKRPNQTARESKSACARFITAQKMLMDASVMFTHSYIFFSSWILVALHDSQFKRNTYFAYTGSWCKPFNLSRVGNSPPPPSLYACFLLIGCLIPQTEGLNCRWVRMLCSQPQLCV